jgi:hypothetical protein
MSLNKPCRILVSSIYTALLITVLATNSLGWNKPGHMTTGAIAFADLRARDPIAAKRVADILNCFISTQFRANVTGAPAGTDRDLVLFVYAARWPDDIRITSEDRPTWHFTNRPFKPAGEPSNIVTAPPAAVNIETASCPPFSTNLCSCGWKWRQGCRQDSRQDGGATS